MSRRRRQLPRLFLSIMPRMGQRSGGHVGLVWISFLVSILAVGVLALRIYLGREAEGHLARDEIIDFAARASGGRTNVFAACPPSYCTPPGDVESPIFMMDWERLRDYWSELIAVQPRVGLVAWDSQRRRATYIERSAVFRFPDIVTVEFVVLGAGKSSLAIDSRSRYGKGDMGVNRNRVVDWLKTLRTMTRDDQRSGGE
jgi:uncharacterized protein (DUF1499 family)